MLSKSLLKAITAIRKLAFCFKVSSTIPTFIRLTSNTKRFKWSKEKALDQASRHAIMNYSFTLENVPRQIYLRTYSGDIQIFYEIFWRSIYAMPSAIFSTARTIVDIGAHVGMATLFFKLKAPEAIVYSVEADDENYKVLLQNLQPEIQNRTVIPIHAALADQNETIYLQRSKLSFNTSISDSVTGLATRGVTIEQLLSEFHITNIDILKIDIEGAETFLFADKAPWLSIVKNIIIELHSDTNIKQFEKAARLHDFRIEQRLYLHEKIYRAYKPSSEVPIS